MVRIANSRLALGFSRATGSLVRVEDRGTGRTHIAGPGAGRLFRILCPSPRWLSRYADSQDCAAPKVEEARGSVVFRWDTLTARDGQVDIAVEVRVELPDDAPAAFFSLQLTNRGTDLVHEVHFPRIEVWKAAGGGKGDRALCGINPVDPHAVFDAPILEYNLGGSKRRKLYPHYATLVPLFDLWGKEGGLSSLCYLENPSLWGILLENHDPEPRGLSLGWAWVHYPFTPPGASWASPRVDLAAHGGDWHEAADRLRAWMGTWWRREAPVNARLRSRLGIQFIQVRGFDGAPFHSFAEVTELARAGMDCGIDDLCLWDPVAGVYLRPDEGDFWEEFDPAHGLGDIIEALRNARSLGANISTLVNFRLIRANSALFRRMGEEQVLRGLHGTMIPEDVSHYSGSHAGWLTGYLGRQGVTLCQRSGAFRRRAIELTRKTLALGFDSLFIDQAFDINPCFARGHGHSSPADTHAAALEWAAQAVAMVRAKGPASYSIGELCDIFALQHFDASWVWHFALAAPEVMKYVVPEASYLMVVDRQPEILNRAFALGFLAAFTTRELEESLAAYPGFGARVRKLAALRERTAAFTTEGCFRDVTGLTLRGCAGHLFEAPGGIGVTLADVKGRGAEVRAAVDCRRLGRTPLGGGDLHTVDGKTVPGAGRRSGSRVRLSTELPELGAAVWEIPCEPHVDSGV